MSFHIGQEVMLTEDMYESDSDNFHPPGHVGKKGDRVIIDRIGRKEIDTWDYYVRHPFVLNNSFGVNANELVE